MGAPRRLRLTRAMRLNRSWEFTSLRHRGHRIVHGCLIANWEKTPAGGASRVGIIAGKAIGGAVLRNRARRWLREAFRIHQDMLTHPIRLVIVARASIASKDWGGVKADYLAALRKARLLKVPDSSA